MISSHIIPAFYLEQFSMPSQRGEDKPGRVWVYEKGKEPDERSTSVQGREKGYFAFVNPDGTLEESFESILANHENECNEVLVCAKSDLFHWPRGSREKLAFYAALLYSRATQRRAFNEKNWRGIISELRGAVGDDQLVRELAQGLSRRLGTPVPEEAIRNGILKWVEESRTPASAKNTFLSDLLQNAEYIASLLLKKEPWRILRSSGNAEVVTSDNPLITFVPLGNGALHTGYGFGKGQAVAAFPLAPSACLVMGDAWSVPGTLDAATLNNLNEALISISDRYVYSKTRSIQVQETVDRYVGTARYGINAFMPVGMKLPSARQFLRSHFGLEPE